MPGACCNMSDLQIGNTIVEYNLKYTNRKKTIGLQLDLDNGLSVSAPKHMNQNDIETILYKKSKWIINKLDRITEITKYSSQKEFLSGEKFLLRGRKYRLTVERTDGETLPSLSFKQSKFHIEISKEIPESDYRMILKPLFIEFYKQKAEKTINNRVKKHLKYFKEKPKYVKIKEPKNKWGSCSAKNRISYNWRIIMAPTSIIDYVVVHELCHIAHKDHSKVFWNTMKSILPDYEERKDWLRLNGDVLKV